MHLRKSTLVLLAAFLLITTVGQSLRAESAPWRALPRDTFLAVRMPNAQKFVDALRSGTKLGKVGFSEERVNKFIELMKEEDGEGWAEMVAELGAVGLSTEDLTAMLKGEVGLSMSAKARDGEDPFLTMILWAEPGEELAAKMFEAMGKGIEKAQDEENPPVRVDYELAGVQVMQVTSPEMGKDFEDAFEEPPGGFANMTPEEIQKFFDEQEEKRKNAKEVVVDYSQAFIAHSGGRLLIAITPPQNRGAFDDNADRAELLQTQTVKGVFARYLETQAAGESVGFAEKAAKILSQNVAMPKGIEAASVYFDVSTFWEMAAAAEAADDAEFQKISKVLGLDRLGAMGAKITLDDAALRSVAFLSAEAPRTGIAGLLDQEAIASEPPVWVGNNVASYSHISMDLGQLYTKIKQMVMEIEPQQAGFAFNMVEAQATTMAQTDLPTMLSAIGSRHSILQFLPKEDGANEDDDEFDNPTANERMALVWQVKDGNIVDKIMQFFKTQADQAAQQGVDAPMKWVEEQGFKGFRFGENMGMEGGVFSGKGYLIWGMGEGVSEQVLAMINNPPQGRASLRNSKAFERATALLTPKPAMAYGLVDYSEMGDFFFKTIGDAMFQAAMTTPFDGDTDPTEIVEKMRELLPTGDEADGMFGVSVGQMFMTDRGLVYEAAWDLPDGE